MITPSPTEEVDHIQPGPYSEDDLRQMWNALGNDERWWDLESWEQLAFAQTQAIEAYRRRRRDPAPAAPALPPALVLIEADQAAMASQAEYEAMAMAEDEAAYWSAQGGQEG